MAKKIVKKQKAKRLPKETAKAFDMSKVIRFPSGKANGVALKDDMSEHENRLEEAARTIKRVKAVISKRFNRK